MPRSDPEFPFGWTNVQHTGPVRDYPDRYCWMDSKNQGQYHSQHEQFVFAGKRQELSVQQTGSVSTRDLPTPFPAVSAPGEPPREMLIRFLAANRRSGVRGWHGHSPRPDNIQWAYRKCRLYPVVSLPQIAIVSNPRTHVLP